MTGPASFVSSYERDAADIVAARAWLETHGYRIRRVDRGDDVLPLFAVTAIPGTLGRVELLALARRIGWTAA